MGLYQLAEYFPHFLEHAPRMAIDAPLKITDQYVKTEHPTTDQPVPVGLDDIETSAATLERRTSTHKFNQLRPFGLWLAIA
jgi:hypothetical protein